MVDNLGNRQYLLIESSYICILFYSQFHFTDLEKNSLAWLRGLLFLLDVSIKRIMNIIDYT